MKTAFRVNVDPDTGYGHIFRCLNIAAALEKAGHEAVFIGNSTPLTEGYASFSFDADMGSPEDIAETSRLLREISPDSLVIDIFPEEKRPPASYASELGFTGTILSFVDSDDEFVPERTLIVNANPGYRGCVDGSGCFKGLDYFILNPAFREIPGEREGIFVSLGSVDENDDLPWILEELAANKEKKVDILASPYASYAAERDVIFNRFPELDIRWHEKISSEKLCELMNAAEMSVTNGGNVMLEMMFFSKPIMVVPSNDRLVKLAEGCARQEGIILCRNRDEFSEKLPCARQFKPQRLVDGRGIERIMKLLLS